MGMPVRSASQAQASASATQPPVMLAVRVPPSAWSTSQSIRMVYSPKAIVAIAARSERPMRRWISWVRPPGPLRSREVRSTVARGQHRVLGGDPSFAASLLEAGNAGLDRRGAVHQGSAHPDEAGALGVRIGAALEHERAKLIVGAAIRTRHGDAPRGRWLRSRARAARGRRAHRAPRPSRRRRCWSRA